MKEILAEKNYALESVQEEEGEEAGRLSFCNLIITEENNSGSTRHSPRTSPARTDPLFEFFISQPGPAARSIHNDIVFCGKVLNEQQQQEDQLLNEYDKRDYFATIKSHSYRRPSSGNQDAASNRRLTASTRFSGDVLARPKCPAGDLVQRVNISSLTSMSAKSRRRMFMFGPVKFRPEMEMRAIKQRQEARRPPAEKAKAKAAAAASTGGGKRQWGVARSSLRGRSNLTSVLARSLGCIPVAGGGGGGRCVGVAN